MKSCRSKTYVDDFEACSLECSSALELLKRFNDFIGDVRHTPEQIAAHN